MRARPENPREPVAARANQVHARHRQDEAGEQGGYAPACVERVADCGQAREPEVVQGMPLG